MRCYGNHPLTLPILFTKGDSRDTQTIHMEIGSNGQTAPDTCSALDTDFSNITSHSILRRVRAAEIVEKLTATPTVSPAWRQISIGWRQRQIFSESDSASSPLEEKGGQKCTLIGKSVVFQSLRRF